MRILVRSAWHCILQVQKQMEWLHLQVNGDSDMWNSLLLIFCWMAIDLKGERFQKNWNSNIAIQKNGYCIPKLLRNTSEEPRDALENVHST